MCPPNNGQHQQRQQHQQLRQLRQQDEGPVHADDNSVTLLACYLHLLFAEIYQPSENNAEAFPYASFLSEFRQEELSEFFSLCSDCDCCDRHQQRRPDVLGPLPDFPRHDGDEHNDGEDHIEYECQCECRQLSRMLCRAWLLARDRQVEGDDVVGGDDLGDESGLLQA